MAVSADTVFFFQEILRFLGRWVPVIQRRDPQPSTDKAGTPAQGIFYFFV